MTDPGVEQLTGDEAPYVTLDDIKASPDRPLPVDYDDGRDPRYSLDYDPDNPPPGDTP